MTNHPEETLYTILDIAPDASPIEVCAAYQQAFELYGDDTLASYSFFPEAERKHLLRRLEEAYLILISPDKRAAYDDELVSQGRLEETGRWRDKSRTPVPLYAFRHARERRDALSTSAGGASTGNGASADPDPFQDRSSLSGQDLKEERIRRAVSLERISQATKIKAAYLTAIEEDRFSDLPPLVYLKGFLKAYAQCLGVNGETLSQGYINHLEKESAVA